MSPTPHGAILLAAAGLAAACLALGGPARAQSPGPLVNRASYTYQDPNGVTLGGTTATTMLADPRGVVTGGDGGALPDFTGFTVGLYTPLAGDPTGTGVGTPLPLPSTGLSGGDPPNTANADPFPLANTTGGTFSFLLDAGQGQTAPGSTYVLLVNPPTGSTYGQRRVRIVFGATNGDQVAYTVTSLDGEPVNATGGQTQIAGSALLTPGPGGTTLAALGFVISVYQAGGLRITKTGDQAAAQPGDTVVYRVTVSDTADQPLSAVRVTDTLPLGFDLRTDSVRAMVQGQRVPVTVARGGATATFTLGGTGTLPAGQTLTVAYAALLTPDAIDGTGINAASVTAQTGLTVNGQATTRTLTDGPATYTVRVQQGLLTDTGTLIGRVFVDSHGDGEPHPGDAGVPGAVILLDDSTRIVADQDGLFSDPTLTAGWHTAALDLRALPGYALARDRRFLEFNSQSRLIRLEPGGLARLDFAVTPRATDGTTVKGSH